MLSTILNKIFQLQRDPVLKYWLMGRLLGRWPGEPKFVAHQPPYLKDLLPLSFEKPTGAFSELPQTEQKNTISLSLAGETVTLTPGNEEKLFLRSFRDLETTLSLHRFTWLSQIDMKTNSAWVKSLWKAWVRHHGIPNNSWAWHPYTAAERVINILIFAQNEGMPGPIDNCLQILALHGPAIANQLEYFGDHHTSNHLANNGRGLFFLGLSLNMPNSTRIGSSILIKEAERIFASSGVLREGSTHYHALLGANYNQCATIASKRRHPATQALEQIAKRANAVTNYFKLPGGFPLIGDISPDSPPESVLNINLTTKKVDTNALAKDGWHRVDKYSWSGLWHASPSGLSHMPGHGHQDCGSFEVHYKDQPIFIDPGRGKYGESGDAALYRSAQVHNNLLIDDADPYPPNKPYYDDSFRLLVSGPSPKIKQNENSIKLTHSGYKRLKNVGAISRNWRFSPLSLLIEDNVEGKSKHWVSRILVTPMKVREYGESLVLEGEKYRFHLVNDCNFKIEPITQWKAYGLGTPAFAIKMILQTNLPWTGKLLLEVI